MLSTTTILSRVCNDCCHLCFFGLNTKIEISTLFSFPQGPSESDVVVVKSEATANAETPVTDVSVNASEKAKDEIPTDYEQFRYLIQSGKVDWNLDDMCKYQEFSDAVCSYLDAQMMLMRGEISEYSCRPLPHDQKEKRTIVRRSNILDVYMRADLMDP